MAASRGYGQAASWAPNACFSRGARSIPPRADGCKPLLGRPTTHDTVRRAFGPTLLLRDANRSEPASLLEYTGRIHTTADGIRILVDTAASLARTAQPANQTVRRARLVDCRAQVPTVVETYRRVHHSPGGDICLSVVQSRLTARWVVDAVGGNHMVSPYRECESLEAAMRHADDWTFSLGAPHDCAQWGCRDWRIEHRVTGDVPSLIQ